MVTTKTATPIPSDVSWASRKDKPTVWYMAIGVWGGGGGAGGAAAPPPQIRANSGWNSGKQWVKFGQSKKKKSARESYKLTPLECGWWRHTGNVQGGGGGGACECPRVGMFFKFWEGGWRHAGNVQGGGVPV